ncbi:MAG: heavy-metal-associated domain-containing protein [Chitinophagaceae bacterium]
MRILIISLIFAFQFSPVQSQFTSARIQASGLTCAMCTKAIYNALGEVSFIQSVDPDISNSSFNVVFKKNVAVNIDKVRKAVEDAGFSIAKMKITGNFKDLAIRNDEHVTIDGSTFHFLKVSDQTLSGNRELTLVDKNFIGAKEFKKYSVSTKMACVQTGKAEACCQKGGVKGVERIYHVTI